MSIIKKMMNKARNLTASEEEIAELRDDQRQFERFSLHRDDIAHVDLHNGLHGIVKDISYGGMAIHFNVNNAGEQSEKMEGSQKGILTVLDRSVPVEIYPRRKAVINPQVFLGAFSITHDSPETLLFLRDIIEPLQRGRSLRQIDGGALREKYPDEQWLCMMGEGPVDLAYRRNDIGNNLDEAFLTFRVNEHYAEVHYEDDKLRTSRTLDEDGPGARMAATQRPDQSLLNYGLFVLLGLPADRRDHAAPFIDRLIKYLSRSESKAV